MGPTQTSTTNFVQVNGNYGWKPAPEPVLVTKPQVEEKNPLPQPPNIEEEISSQNLYKTELCRSFEDTGSCRYGTKCQFAHGKAELRPVLRHPKYKTEVCKTFYNTGTCPYGRRCRFIHSTPDKKPQVTNKTKTTGLSSSSSAVQKQQKQQKQQQQHRVANVPVQNDLYTEEQQGYVSISSSNTWNAPGAPVRQQNNSDSSWVEAMSSLTISPSSELVQLVIPEQDRVPVRNEDRNKGGRLSFFESITGGQ